MENWKEIYKTNTPTHEVIKHKVWKNKKTGQQASIYGAGPYYTDAEGENWSIVETGSYSIHDKTNNTVHGNQNPPYTWTKAEAQTIADKLNAIYN